MKGENEARTFAFDVAAFHIDWDDIQLLARVNGVGINTNAGGAESDGVEASLMFRPVDRLKLSLTGAYTDAKLTEDTDLLAGRRARRRSFAVYTRRPAIRRAPTTSGRWPTIAARTSALHSAICRKCPPPSIRHSSRRMTANASCPSYDMLDVRAGWDFGKVSLEVFGRNLTDDEGKTSDATGNTPLGAIATGVIRPRSYGVTVTAEF